MLAQTLVLAESAGFGPRLWTRFPDAGVAALVGADGVQEFPLALVTLGEGEPAIRPGGEAARGSMGDAPIEFPLITLAQRAGDMDALGDPWPAAPPLPGAVPPSDDLDAVDPAAGLGAPDGSAPRPWPARSLDFSLAASMRGSTRPPLRRRPRRGGHGARALPLARPRPPPAARARSGRSSCSPAGTRTSGGTPPSSSSARSTSTRIDDRGYREAQLDAGIVEGRLHLAAYALGIGARGMTFLDSEIEPLLGEPLAALLFTCVGVPTYPGKAGGMPGSPVSIVTPSSGDTPRDPARQPQD